MELPIVLIPHPHVRVDKGVMRGSPYVVGTRVPVRRLWAFYRSGASVDTLLKRYPKLDPGKIFDALAFAFDNQAVIEADIARENQLVHGMSLAPGSRYRQMALPFEPEG